MFFDLLLDTENSNQDRDISSLVSKLQSVAQEIQKYLLIPSVVSKDLLQKSKMVLFVNHSC